MVLATHYILLYLCRDLQDSSVSVDLLKQLVLIRSYHCTCVVFCSLHQTKLGSIQKLVRVHMDVA